MSNYYNREEFIKVINRIQKLDNIYVKINKLFIDNEMGAEIIGLPNLVPELIGTLSRMYEDDDDWISYYCYEIWFGEGYNPGSITAADGTDIPLGDAGDLWDLLIYNLQMKYNDNTIGEELHENVD